MSAQWVAPSEDGGLLIDPPLVEVPRLFDQNQKRLSAANVRILGQSLQELRTRAQKSLEIAHTLWYPHRDPHRPDWRRGPVIVSGHQPDLFHPGVWVKNFALNGLARKLGANSLNLVIDSDTIKSVSVRVPVRDSDPARVRIADIAFDDWTGEAPFDLYRIQNRDQFFDFPDRVAEIWCKWDHVPLLPKFWKRVTESDALIAGPLREMNDQVPDSGLKIPGIGACFAQGRRGIEREWGCFNFELPLCEALESHEVEAVILHFLSDLPRFHGVYNECVRAYRQRHGLHSRNHPVPDLVADGDLFEAPFWIDNDKRGRLGRLMVRRRGDRLDLFYHPQSECVTIRVDTTEMAAFLEANDWSIRTRALTTTLFARLLFADLFIHGIGGAKYDEVTDDIIRRYFGMEPPAYMVVSGTLRLPFPTFPSTRDDRHRLQHRLRDLEWNPQKCGSSDAPDVAELMVQYRKWTATETETHAGRRERFRALRGINEQLRRVVPESERAAVQAELVRVDSELSANEILRRRDYAFCLYPEELLRPFCTQFL